MKGAFQTSREIFENPIWSDVVKFRIFFYIVGNAVFAEEGLRVGDMLLERGQYLRSYRNLQKDLEYIDNKSVKQYSLSVLKRKIDQLVMENRLISKETELGTLFTVVNYALYQGLDNYKNPTKNGKRTVKEQQENSERTPEEQQENNNNNDNNVKKVKNENIKDMYSSEFELFWNSYPRKIGKKDCFKTWNTVIKKEDPNVIIQCSQNYKKQCELRKTETQFIKHPKSFLNEERYKDYLVEEEQPGGYKPTQPFSSGQTAAGKYNSNNSKGTGSGKPVSIPSDGSQSGRGAQENSDGSRSKYDMFVRR